MKQSILDTDSYVLHVNFIQEISFGYANCADLDGHGIYMCRHCYVVILNDLPVKCRGVAPGDLEKL